MSSWTITLAQAGLNHSPVTIAGLIVLILDILVIISVLAGKGTVGHKLLWSLIVILLPLVGLILYFFLGRNRADRPFME